MTESDFAGRDNAYRQLKTTLDDISSSFKKWAKGFDTNSAESRMSSAISAAVDQYSNSAAQTILGNLTKIPMDQLVSIERYISQSFRDLNLVSVRNLHDLEAVLQWVDMAYVMELDPIQFDPSLLNDPSTAQQTNKIRRTQIDLQYLFEKEKQQEHLDRSISEALSKLDSISMDPAQLSAVQNQLIAQNREFLTWQSNADKLAQELASTKEELRVTKESIADLELKSLRASDNFEAAQTRYDIVSEETSANQLVEHFKNFEGKHNTSRLIFFVSGLAILLLVTTFSVIFAFQAISTAITPTGASWRFAIAAGGGAIGTYLLRLATYHRRLSVWADTMQVQLQTFAAYTEQIGDEGSKNQLRAEFAKRVFGDEPGRPSSSSDSSGDSISASDLSTIIANLAKVQPK
ncbi:hypothetical protein D3C74_184710 [compost metagenome]